MIDQAPSYAHGDILLLSSDLCLYHILQFTRASSHLVCINILIPHQLLHSVWSLTVTSAHDQKAVDTSDQGV